MLLAALACQQEQPSLDDLYQAGYAGLYRGELEAAHSKAEEGRARARAEGQPAWEWAFQVLEAEVLASRRQNDEALALLEPGLVRSTPADAVQVRALMAQGLVLCVAAGRGSFRGAERALEEAARSAVALGSQELLGEVDLRRGTCSLVQKRYAEAEDFFAQALAMARQEGVLHLEANVTGSLGVLRARTGRYDEATEWLKRSLEIAKEIGADVPRVKTLSNLGWCYLELGDDERALPLLMQAEALAANLGLTGDRLVVLTNMGRSMRRLGTYAEANDVYSHALKLARELNDRQTTARLLSNMAMVALDERRYRAAETYVRDALEIKEELGDLSGQQNSLLIRGRILVAGGFLAEAEDLYHRVIDSPHTVPHLRMEAYGDLAKLYAETGRPAQAEEDFKKAFQLMEESRNRLRKVGHKLSFFSNLKGIFDGYIELLVDTGRLEEALRMAAESRARLIRERQHRARDEGAVVTADALKRLAESADAVLLSYWTAPKGSFLWVITGHRVELRKLPDEPKLRRDIEAYQAAILRSQDPLAEAIPEGESLWRSLVAPASDLIPQDGRVVVVPDGPLHQLNFETLIVPGPHPHYWIEDVTVAATPSLSLLSARPRPQTSEQSILIIGDPLPPNDEFPRLAHAGREVQQIAELFDPDLRSVYSGVHANPSSYERAEPARFAFIHLAAHVTANREIPLESAVILSPEGETYKLYARDVIDIPLHAELVTLSACRSAGSRAFAGEGLVGLAWAFMNAGARNVIGGLWDVEDASTSQLMEHLYRGLQEGLDPAQALRQAKLELLRSGTAYGKPFYWAPFVTYHGPAGLAARGDAAGLSR